MNIWIKTNNTNLPDGSCPSCKTNINRNKINMSSDVRHIEFVIYCRNNDYEAYHEASDTKFVF